MQSYKHKLEAADLRKAAVENPNATIMPLTELYKDGHAHIVRKEWTGIQKFNVDSNRQVKINGKNNRVPREGEGEFKNFREMIQQELKIDPEKINNSYTQDLMNLTMFPFSYNSEIGIAAKGIMYTPIGMETDMYREGDNVYFKARIEAYDVVYTKETQQAHNILKGPVEVLYKLEDSDKKGIFKLQYMATDSDFVRDVFLGEQAGLADRLRSEAKVDPVKLKQDIVKDLELQLLICPASRSDLTSDKAILLKQTMQETFAQAFGMVDKFNQGKISANQLVETLERLKPGIEIAEAELNSISNSAATTFTKRPSFIKRHSFIGKKEDVKKEEPKNNANFDSLHAFEVAIEKAKVLPDYQRTQVNENTASLSKEKVSASNDVKIEKEEQPVVRIHMGGPGRGSA